MDSETDLYANTGGYMYLRLSGNYFRWVVGKGWESVTSESVIHVMGWAKLHEKQLEAYRPGLVEKGLIS